MGWDQAEERAKRDSSGVYVRLQDGDSIEGAVLGDPSIREQVWQDGKSEPYDAGKHAGLRPTVRYVLNFYVPGTGMKILELGTRTFSQLLLMRKKTDLSKRMIEITRIGSGKDTAYTIGKGEDITDELRKEIKAAERHDLGAPAKQAAPADDMCPF